MNLVVFESLPETCELCCIDLKARRLPEVSIEEILGSYLPTKLLEQPRPEIRDVMFYPSALSLSRFRCRHKDTSQLSRMRPTRSLYTHLLSQNTAAFAQTCRLRYPYPNNNNQNNAAKKLTQDLLHQSIGSNRRNDNTLQSDHPHLRKHPYHTEKRREISPRSLTRRLVHPVLVLIIPIKRL
jgi:hypothetical protein